MHIIERKYFTISLLFILIEVNVLVSNFNITFWMFLVFSLVQFSHSAVSDSLWSHESQHTRPPCPSPTPRVHWNSRPLSRWCHPAISSSVVPFSSHPQSFPASASFQMSQLFTSGGLFTSGWISLLSKGLSRVFSNTTVQKHQFFGAQLSSQSNSHIHTWPLEKP